MRANPRAVLHAMRGLQTVMDDNKVLGSLNTSGARKRFDMLAEELGDTLGPAAARLQEQKGLTAEKKQLVETVREDYMRPITDAAAVLGESFAELRPIKLPSARRVGAFVVDSRGILTMFAKHRDAFAALGIAPDVDATVLPMLARIESLSAIRDLERGGRVGSNIAARTIVAKVPPVLRLLDSMARPILRKHEKLLRQWEEARRLARATSARALPAPKPMKLLPASTGESAPRPTPEASQRRRRRRRR